MRMLPKVPERINIIGLILTQDGRQKEDCVWLQKLVLYSLFAFRLSYLEWFKLVEVLHLFEELPHIDAARRFAIRGGEGGNQSHHVAHQVNFPGMGGMICLISRMVCFFLVKVLQAWSEAFSPHSVAVVTLDWGCQKEASRQPRASFPGRWWSKRQFAGLPVAPLDWGLCACKSF